MFKKIFMTLLILSSLLALCGLLAACGGKEEPTQAPTAIPTATVAPTKPVQEESSSEAVTIRFAVSDLEQPMYEDLIKSFEEENPDVKIKMISLNETLGLTAVGGDWPDDAWARLASAADVINVLPSTDVIDSGLVLDISPFLESDPNGRPEDFFPNALTQCQSENGTWCLPTMVSYNMVYFDKDVFDAAGEPYPEPGWTWDDLLAKATAVTQKEGDQVNEWGFVYPGISYADTIASWVGPLVDDTASPPEVLFDRPEVIAAATWLTDLTVKYDVMPYFEPSGDEGQLSVSQDQKLIDEKRAAMWVANSLLYTWQTQQRNLGIAPFPIDAPGSGGEGNNTTPVSVDGSAISAGTAQPQAAWRWLNALTLHKIDLMGLSFMPARRSVAEASGFWEGTDEGLMNALHFAVDHAFARDTRPGYQAFNDSLSKVLAGNSTVEDALAEARTQALDEIDESAAAKAGATPAPTVVVSAGNEQTTNPNATSIVYTVGPSDLYDPGAIRDLALKFQEQHPDIVIDVKQPNLYDVNALNIKSLAQSADCFGWAPDFQDPENLDAILNIEPFIDADPSFTVDDFYPLMISRFTYQGQLWGLPSQASTYVIEYNKDIFDDAGVDYPQVTPSSKLNEIWTTDEFLQTAVALTQGEDDSKIYGFVPGYYEVNDLVFFSERLGVLFLDDSVDPPSVNLVDPSVIKAVQWYIDLSNEYGVKPAYIGDIADILSNTSIALDREAVINDGRGAMWTALGSTNILGGREGLNVGIAPLPADSSAASAYISPEGYFISASTEARQQCWQWITYLSNQPEAVQNIPARKSLAESADFLNKVGEERQATYLATMAAADQPSSLQFLEDEPWLSVGLIWLGRAYSEARDGEQTLEEALNNAQDLFDQYRLCVVSNDAVADQKAWQACVTETDPAFPSFIFGQ